MAGRSLGWYDYGKRFYEPEIARFQTLDSLAEKNYYESPYVYVGDNPMIYVDLKGLTKLKVEGSLKFTTMIVGIGFKGLIGGDYSLGGIENEIGLNITFDTKTLDLSIGVSLTSTDVKKGGYSISGVVGGGEKKVKETKNEAKASVNLKTGKLNAKVESSKDDNFVKSEEGSVGVYTGSEKEGEADKSNIGLSPEVNAGLIGVGLGLNFSWQGTSEKQKNEKEQTTTQSK